MTRVHSPEAPLVRWAAAQAQALLGELADRWLHVQGVAERAREAMAVLDEEDRPHLVAAAYLHDIGYAPNLRRTGFHPLDGARWLEANGADDRLCALVAHHSAAAFEAKERGLSSDLGRWATQDGALQDALVYSDMTISPAGDRVTVRERISDVLRRYPAEDPVHRAMLAAEPALCAAVDRTERRLRVGSAQPMYGAGRRSR